MKPSDETRIRGQMIDAVVRALAAELAPDKIILFGSSARGNAHRDSDVDLLVILPEVADGHAEMRRAYQVLGKVSPRPPVDVLVFSRNDVQEWGNVVGHVINEALVDGKVAYDAA
jgi:predicted nucleotidyltransferase